MNWWIKIKPCAVRVWGICVGLAADLTQKRADIDVWCLLW